MEIQKSHLKRLLDDHFEEDEDFIIEEKNIGKGKGRGGNNRKKIMLTYTCAKLLCMLSKTKKADAIRRFYVELEKLIILYKDNIVNDLNTQLGIKTKNRKIIERNKEKGLIYVLKIDDSLIKSDQDNFSAKIGNSEDIKKRMKQYKVGRIDELPIVYIYITDNLIEIENCIKDCLKRRQIVNNTETFNLNLEEIKETVKYCNKLKSQLIVHNKKLLKKDGSYLIMTEVGNTEDLMEKIGIIKKHKSKSSKKGSKNGSKKGSQNGSKKINSSKSSKNGSKKVKSSKGSQKVNKKKKSYKKSRATIDNNEI